MSTTRIQRTVVIDDHPLLRKGLQQLADLSPNIEVVGEANNGTEGLALVCQLMPDLVLLDLNMPEQNGLETLVALKALKLDIRVVILTVSDAEEDVVAALRAGADGYLLKDIDPELLLEKFLEVAKGRLVMSPNITECLARALQSQHLHATARDDLTEREREILHHISRGESNKVIGRNLSITEATVKVHVKHLLKKLGLKTRVEAAVWNVTHITRL